MKKLVLGLLGVGGLLRSPAAQGQVALDKRGWTVVFEDDFRDPATVDPASPTRKWYDGYYFGSPTHRLGTNLAYYSADNVRVHDGVVELTTQDVADQPVAYDGQQFGYKSGALTSRFDDVAYSGCRANGQSIGDNGFLYGLFEVRCRLPRGGDGRLGAFWLYGGAEVDVFEFNGGAPGRFMSTVQPIGNPPLDKACSTFHAQVGPSELADDYHVYTLVWTPTEISWFFDGREIRTDRDPRHVPVGCEWRRLQVCLDAEVWYRPQNLQAQNFSVDYVRVYKPANGDYATTPYRQATAVNGFERLHPADSASSPAPRPAPGPPTRRFDATAANEVLYLGDDGRLLRLRPGPDPGQWAAQALPEAGAGAVANLRVAPDGASGFYSDAAGRLFRFATAADAPAECLNPQVADVANNLVVADAGRTLYYRNRRGGLSRCGAGPAWRHAPLQEAPAVAAAEGAVAVAEPYVFFVTPRGQVQYLAWTGRDYTQAADVPGAAPAQGALAVQAHDPARGLAGLRLFYIGRDGLIYQAERVGGAWQVAPLRAAANAADYLCVAGEQLYYRGRDGRLWNAYWYEGAWRVAPIGYGTGPAVGGGLVAGGEGRVFFSGPRGLYGTRPGPSRLDALPCAEGADPPALPLGN